MASPIKTIVILVQENRSFDHMLGWMKSINPEIDGVTGKESNLLSTTNHDSKRLYHTNKAGFIQPDPGHSFEATYEQVFGVEWTESSNAVTKTPTMDGFAQQAEKVQQGLSEVVMSGFEPDSLPVYKELISEFAVCDRWFSSIPTLTQPNRLYVHSATSYGATTNDNKMMIEGYPQKTIFESVEDGGFSFGIYYQLPPSTLFFRYILERMDNYRDDSDVEYPTPDSELGSPDMRPEFDYDPSPFYIDEEFESHEELTNWAQTTGRDLGYVFVKRRSNTNTDGVVNKVCLVCDRSGKRDKRSKGPVVRSLKIECPFRLEGHLTRDNRWRVNVVDYRHNHHPAQSLEGHAYARRMSADERAFVEKEIQHGTDPRRILVMLKAEFPGNLSRVQDIRNIVKSIREEKAGEVGETRMQVMFHLLQQNNYLYHYTTNSESGPLENLFFIHPLSFDIWRAFPWIVEIDATYKTNLYNMPLVEIVGVTSTGKTFSIAYAFITSEQEAHYRWVLQCLKSTLDEGFCVRVVLTDRDLALIRACRDVMPTTKLLLCRVHI